MPRGVESQILDPALLLRAYASGIFPMAEAADDPEVFWVQPDMRGVIPLDAFHVPASLVRTLKRGTFDLRINTNFSAVMRGCAEQVSERPTTWINQSILDAYTGLHAIGHCHSVEAWQGDELVGGLYGVSLGSAFFGESMFSRRTDASKACLVRLVGQLRERGFTLLDTQFTTDHLKRFGAIDVPRRKYEKLLAAALSKSATFWP